MNPEEKVKRKYVRKNPSNSKKKVKTDADPPALDFVPDPTTEKPEPLITDKSYVLDEQGKWVEEEQPLSIEALVNDFNEAISDPLVDLLSCPFHCKPLTRKKPTTEEEGEKKKKEVLFCPVLGCPVFLFAENMEPYVRALHYTLPSKDVEECWDILACYCNEAPSLKLSTSRLNPNRLYLVCNNFNKDLKCPYFQWFEEPFSPKTAAWQDEIRFVLSHQPVPENRQEAKEQEKQRKERAKQENLLTYFGSMQTRLKCKREELEELPAGPSAVKAAADAALAEVARGGGGARGARGGQWQERTEKSICVLYEKLLRP